jgi:hypothetical protein
MKAIGGLELGVLASSAKHRELMALHDQLDVLVELAAAAPNEQPQDRSELRSRRMREASIKPLTSRATEPQLGPSRVLTPFTRRTLNRDLAGEPSPARRSSSGDHTLPVDEARARR